MHVLALSAVFVLSSLLAHAATDKKSFDVPAGVAPASLKQFAEQAGGHVLYSVDDVTGVKTLAVKGEFTPREALNRMLAGTTLYIDSDPQTEALTVRKETEAEAKNVSRAIAENNKSARPEKSIISDESADGEKIVKLDTFEVFGRKTLNMDISRTESDARPYFVYDQGAIERSGAINLEEFLMRQVTSSVVSNTSMQSISEFNSSSRIDLRGFGSDETLILVDGRRMAGGSVRGDPTQPSVNTIPISAIERIEVLSMTGSGIYGGGATGGVINIILKRDYSGSSIDISYGNSVKSDTLAKQISITTHASSCGGRLKLYVSASMSDASELRNRDRDFYERGISHILSHDPGSIFNSTIPPLGSTTNVRSLLGSNLTLKAKYGGAALNSPFTSVPRNYAGPLSDNGLGLVANNGKYNLDLSNTAGGTSGGNKTLWAAPDLRQIMATADLALNDKARLYFEGNLSQTKSAVNIGSTGSYLLFPFNNGNPFNEIVFVTPPLGGTDQNVTSEVQNQRVVLGFASELVSGWDVSVDTSYGRSRYSSSTANFTLSSQASAAISSGLVNVFSDTPGSADAYRAFLLAPTRTYPIVTSVYEIAARSSRRVDLPWSNRAGTIAASAAYRKDDWGSSLIESRTPTNELSYTLNPGRHQENYTAYIEANTPLVSGENQREHAAKAEVQIAARFDSYRIAGAQKVYSSVELNQAHEPLVPPLTVTQVLNSVNPVIAILARPINGITLRGSFATGFLPPSAGDLVQGAPQTLSAIQFTGIFDPLRGNEALGDITVVQGGNPRLRPEKTRSHSLGIIYEPYKLLNGLRISCDWTKIRKTDAIYQPGINFRLQDYIKYVPASAGRAEQGNDGYPFGKITSLDLRAINLSGQKIEALDFGIDYHAEPLAGNLRWYGRAKATINLDSRRQFAGGAPWSDDLGLISSLKWRGFATIGFEWNSFTIEWGSYLYSGYFVNSSHTIDLRQGSDTVPSQSYSNLSIVYKFAKRGNNSFQRLLGQSKLSFSITNIFDQSPPTDVTAIGVPYYSTLGDPRLRTYQVSLKKEF